MKLTKIAIAVMAVAAVAMAFAFPAPPVLRIGAILEQDPPAAKPGPGFGFSFQPQSDTVVPAVVQPLWTSDLGLPPELWFAPKKIEVGGLFGVYDETAQIGAAFYGVWPRNDFELLLGVSYMDSWQKVNFEGFTKNLGVFVGGRFRL